MKIRNRVVKAGVAVAGVVAGASAMAAGPDYTTLTGAIDFGTTTTAILAVLALVVVPVLAYKGGKMALKALKGA